METFIVNFKEIAKTKSSILSPSFWILKKRISKYQGEMIKVEDLTQAEIETLKYFISRCLRKYEGPHCEHIANAWFDSLFEDGVPAQLLDKAKEIIKIREKINKQKEKLEELSEI